MIAMATMVVMVFAIYTIQANRSTLDAFFSN